MYKMHPYFWCSIWDKKGASCTRVDTVVSRGLTLRTLFCFQTVLTKQPLSERRFGILSNCSHVFCLSCIRKWRSATQFENKTIRYIGAHFSIISAQVFVIRTQSAVLLFA